MKTKILAIDFDTILFRSTKILQEDSIIAEHKLHKFYKPCKNITTFWGTKKHEVGGWLNDLNIEASTNFTKEDFEIENQSKIIAPDSVAKNRLKEYISDLYDIPWVKTLKIVLGGADNFRYDIFPEYKSNRGPKPLKFYEIKDWFCEEFKDIVVLSENSEADDWVSIIGWWGYREFGDKTPIVIGHCDKDCDQIPGLHFNYDKRTEPYWVNEFKGHRRLCEQILLGDTTDFIQGIPKVNQEIADKYSIGLGGLGIVKAKAILKDLESIESLYTEVEEVYKCYYGKDYKEPLNLSYKLVHLLEEKNKIMDFPFKV